MDVGYELRLKGPLFERQDVQAAFDAEISAELSALGGIGQRILVAGTPRGASGNLRGSEITELRGAPGRREVSLHSSAFYSPFVERGRRPGKQPPTAPLVQWVVRKLGIVDAKKARGVAFVIARKIGRVGTSGAAMFFRTAEQLQPIAEARWRALSERLAERLGGS